MQHKASPPGPRLSRGSPRLLRPKAPAPTGIQQKQVAAEPEHRAWIKRSRPPSGSRQRVPFSDRGSRRGSRRGPRRGSRRATHGKLTATSATPKQRARALLTTHGKLTAHSRQQHSRQTHGKLTARPAGGGRGARWGCQTLRSEIGGGRTASWCKAEERFRPAWPKRQPRSPLPAGQGPCGVMKKDQ